MRFGEGGGLRVGLMNGMSGLGWLGQVLGHVMLGLGNNEMQMKSYYGWRRMAVKGARSSLVSSCSTVLRQELNG